MGTEPFSPAGDLAETLDRIPPGTKVLCAVSGGADSVCLLHLLSRREDLSLRAAHFNHCLRGEESLRDETFVRSLCHDWGIPLDVGQGDVAAYAGEEGLSIEEAAREMRYAFLRKTAQQRGCALIATAHNAGDNVETLLLHLLRGTGLHGLAGIPPRTRDLARPLLSTSREEIQAYLARWGLPHVEDSSNADERYARNRVRRQLIPLLEEMSPGFSRRLTAAIPRLRADDDFLESLALPIAEQAAEPEGEVRLPAALITQAPGPVALRAVRLLLAKAGGEDSSDFGSAHMEAVLALCAGEDPSAQVSLPHGLIARREYEELVLTRQSRPGPIRPFSPRQGENPVPGTPWQLSLDGPPWAGLVVRSRQTGDEITLPGGYTKSVKKLLIDRKIPLWQRESIPVAADDRGVIAVAGLGSNQAHPRRDKVKFIKEREEKET